MKKSLRTVGCFLEYDGKFLILLRRQDKPQGNTWGLPAGKVNADENDREAITREAFEETGYQLDDAKLEFLGDFVFEFPDLHLEFPTFRVMLDKPIKIHIDNSTHQTFKWVSGDEAYAMPDLIHGFHKLLERTGYATAKGKL